ncbi:hypothetical protein PSHT_09335 [Puccinia striiformis]|uniref:Uncharacterized protein n=1 Tax=Puccinia striiformis TaxID=27350 RepID=A0A2S4VHD9_9BASI|nr:hypothetical protein PSHT_09335 [Puccinia striiformis]
MVTANAQNISRSIVTAANSIDSILPLHMVTCLITSVIPGQGLNCHSTTCLELNGKLKVGQKICARILWDTISRSQEPHLN